MPLRLAVATEDFDTPIKKAIGLASELQVPGVRLNTRSELNIGKASSTALRQILLYVQERQMQIAGLSCPTKHALYDENFLEPRLEVIRNSMTLARQLNTTELLIRCGPIPDPDAETTASPSEATAIDDAANPFSFPASQPSTALASPAQQFSTLCQILNELAQHGNHVGCVINLQLPDFHLGLMKRLLNEVKAGPLNLVFDPATAIMSGAEVDRTYRDIYEHVGYVRARDAVQNLDGASTEAGLGKGIVDWIQFMPTLIEANYEGWVCVERTGGDSRADDVRQGVSELKRLIPQTSN